ncbi:hypothetical protein CHARACLAT_033487 [Characodon lateralis]|uniref:Secreted protein n=1 Tax=Characodon lateralis TaxID=208331 RepID=A0ABU7DCI2_9TELE|nr:hypothetical protein [Characodon lateralis]
MYLTFSWGCLFFYIRFFLGLEGFIFHFSTVGRQERGAEKGGDIRQRSLGQRLEFGTTASTAVASTCGRVLNPNTTSAMPSWGPFCMNYCINVERHGGKKPVALPRC